MVFAHDSFRHLESWRVASMLQVQRLKAKLVQMENALSVARKDVETERQAKEDARRVRAHHAMLLWAMRRQCDWLPSGQQYGCTPALCMLSND